MGIRNGKRINFVLVYHEEMFTLVRDRDKDQDWLFPIVLVPFPVLVVPFPD